ncbi:hypothetical protein ACEUXC_08250, partial [Staphylococcus pseudintermedius]
RLLECLVGSEICIRDRTGIPICLSTAQIASLDIGRKINKVIISEPTGRFPWFPREADWNNSWLNILKKQRK